VNFITVVIKFESVPNNLAAAVKVGRNHAILLVFWSITIIFKSIYFKRKEQVS
jgi:hypothetical protein